MNPTNNINNINYTSSFSTNEKFTNTNSLRSSYINTNNIHTPVYTKQNISTSKIFTYNSPSTSTNTNGVNNDKNILFDTKLNLDFMNKKNNGGKIYQELQYHTELPITQIIKKKYQL